MIRTIPDTIDLIKRKYKRFIDVPLSWMEHIGSKNECICMEQTLGKQGPWNRV